MTTTVGTTVSTSTLASTAPGPTPGPTSPDYLNQDDIDDLQTQLYIISGVFGGIIVILAILVVLLAVAVSSLKKKLNKQIKAAPKQSAPEPDLYGGSLSNRGNHDSQGTFGRRTASPPPAAAPAVVSEQPRPGYGWERRGHRESVHDPVQFGPREGQGQGQGQGQRQEQGQRQSRNPSLQQHESWELEQHKPNNPRSSSRYSGRRSYQQELGSKYY